MAKHEFRGDIDGPSPHVSRPAVTLLAFYVVVITLGILSMGFQLLASRLLNPHFGSSIIVWAWLISTFLAAFSIGSMVGGWISNLAPAPRRRGQLIGVVIAVASLALVAAFGRVLLGRIEVAFEDVSTALLVSCVGIFFLPVTALSTFGPQCVQFLATRGTPPGQASGIVYGVSTLGNIAGVMLTAFALIPHFRVSTLLYLWLAVAVVSLACLVRLLRVPPYP
jgi:MFS family permease